VNPLLGAFAWGVGIWLTVAIYVSALRPHRPEPERIPAAPDNQPGTDTDALTTCQHIARIPAQIRKENP
jgi:hypothetical protein